MRKKAVVGGLSFVILCLLLWPFQNCAPFYAPRVGHSDQSSMAVATTSDPAPPATPTLASPQILSQPVSQLLHAGDAVAFAVDANGYPTPQYQWFRDGKAIPNANTNVLSIAQVQDADAGKYTVHVYNVVGSVDSQPAQLSLVKEIHLTSNANQYNLYRALGSPTTPVTIELAIEPGVVVSSSNPQVPAFSTQGNWASGSKLTLVNKGQVIGAGGAGGLGSAHNGAPGGNGGDAMLIALPTDLSNDGTIAGGGGGGGGGSSTGCGECYDDPGGSGGGGAGYGHGGAVPSGKPSCFGGASGGLITGGRPGSPCANGSGEWASGGPGGAGGALGQPGQAGSSRGYTGGRGGQPGAALTGGDLVNWQVKGTVIGAVK